MIWLKLYLHFSSVPSSPVASLPFSAALSDLVCNEVSRLLNTTVLSFHLMLGFLSLDVSPSSGASPSPCVSSSLSSSEFNRAACEHVNVEGNPLECSLE